MLSNTAVPKYYAEFRDQVIAGKIPVCREISMEMNRIDSLIANPSIYYDDEAVEGFFRFCENECTLTDGSDLELLPSFKLWAEQVFGWYFFEERPVYVPATETVPGHYETQAIKKRLTVKQYLIVARGAAKSMYASLIQNYFLNIDTSTTHQVTTAPTMSQAEEVMSPIRTAITRSRGPLFKFLTEGSINNTSGSRSKRVKLASTKKGIENFLTGSLLEVRPMNIDKLQGLRAIICTIDEWLSGAIRQDPVGCLEQGASKNENYLILATSSEGTVRNSVGDTIKMELLDILRGEYVNPRVSIWYYRLDDISEVAHPELWLKANPNLGRTVSYATYQADVERAEKAPSTRNDILAKRFGIPMEGQTYFFTYEQTLPHRRRMFCTLPCSLGMDLSMGDDFCAFTFLFPIRGGAFGVKTRAYISARTYDKLMGALRLKYDDFINEGTLMVLDGPSQVVLDMEQVYDDLIRFIDNNGYQVLCVGYDPYNADKIIEKWGLDFGTYGIETVRQGKITESVPLGELHKLAEDRLLIFDEDMMQFCMGNSIVITDTNGMKKLNKLRADAKIDCVAAMMDAYVAYKLHRELFD